MVRKVDWRMLHPGNLAQAKQQDWEVEKSPAAMSSADTEGPSAANPCSHDCVKETAAAFSATLDVRANGEDVGMLSDGKEDTDEKNASERTEEGMGDAAPAEDKRSEEGTGSVVGSEDEGYATENEEDALEEAAEEFNAGHAGAWATEGVENASRGNGEGADGEQQSGGNSDPQSGENDGKAAALPAEIDLATSVPLPPLPPSHPSASDGGGGAQRKDKEEGGDRKSVV